MDDDNFDLRQIEPQLHLGARRRFPAIFAIEPVRDFIRQIEDPNFQERRYDQARVIPRDQRLVYTVYFLWIIPLPVINFPVVWRRIRQHTLSQWIGKLGYALSRLLIRLGRIIWYTLIMIWWLEDVCKFISVFGSMATFSSAFFVDVTTYLFRNWPILLQRKAYLIEKWGEEPPIIQLESILQFVLDNASLHVRAICKKSENEVVSCVVDDNSLIFRFSDVVLRSWPFFEKSPNVALTITTTLLYLGYGILAQLIGSNVLIFLGVHTIHRWLPSTYFYSNLMKMIWNHSAGLVW